MLPSPIKSTTTGKKLRKKLVPKNRPRVTKKVMEWKSGRLSTSSAIASVLAEINNSNVAFVLCASAMKLTTLSWKTKDCLSHRGRTSNALNHAMLWTFRKDTVIGTSSFQGRNWEKKLVLKTPNAQISSISIWWLLTLSLGSPRKLWNETEWYADSLLPVHLLPCLQINNSNVGFALFALALKLELSCQSWP